MYRHVEVYVDESGDLGFSASASRHIVAVALATARPVEIRRLIRKAQGRFGPSENRLGELKFNRASLGLRMHVLEAIARTDSWVACRAAFKPGLAAANRIDGELLLLTLCRDAVGEIAAGVRSRKMSVIVDRRRVKEKTRERFDELVRSTVLNRHSGFFPPDVEISHFDSQTSEGLQAADFVAGAVFRDLEKGDSSYIDVIQPKVLSSVIR